MFPLNSNQTYIKDTGERSTLGKVIGSGGGSELPAHTAADEGKVLSITDSGDLAWDSSSKNITPVYSGLSYGYESGGKWVGSDTKKYYLLLFPVTANKIYLINKADQVGNRCRAGFFANKTLDDFTSAIESPSTGIIYDGVNIIDLASTDVASAIAITNASGIIALVVDSESKTTSTGVCVEL